ncbi:hypothetical protein ANO11243_001540 [Dothideomycetidae sp. 11243]|nr:hypothetical protein ANO11243_001540 [fungal sp. No.11243]
MPATACYSTASDKAEKPTRRQVAGWRCPMRPMRGQARLQPQDGQGIGQGMDGRWEGDSKAPQGGRRVMRSVLSVLSSVRRAARLVRRHGIGPGQRLQWPRLVRDAQQSFVLLGPAAVSFAGCCGPHRADRHPMRPPPEDAHNRDDGGLLTAAEPAFRHRLSSHQPSAIPPRYTATRATTHYPQNLP